MRAPWPNRSSQHKRYGPARPSRRGGLMTLSASLAVVMMLTACSSTKRSASDGSETSQPSRGTDSPISKLTWGVPSGPRSLDSQHGYDGATWTVYGELAEPLLTIDNAAKLKPKLASSWKQPTPSSIVFTLRDDVKFWDGKPLTAEDVVWSLNRTSDPEVASEFASFWTAVKSVEATAENQVTVTLTGPDPMFIYNFRFPVIYQKAHGVDAGADFGGPSGLIMGTGPYKIDKFSPTTGASMTRFEGYWGARPTAKKIDVKVISDPDTLRLAVQSGEVDGMFGLPLDNAGDWEGLDSAKVGFGPSSLTSLLILDTTKPPFNDVHARRAIAYALDRPGIVKALLSGHGVPAQSISAPFLWNNVATKEEVKKFYSTLPDLNLDLDKAKAELAKSATPDGFTVTVNAPNERPEYSKVLETLKENAKGLGIDIVIKPTPLATWLAELRAPAKSPMGIIGFTVTSPDPISLVTSLVTGTDVPGGYTAYAPPEMMKLMGEYKAATPTQQLDIAKTIVGQLSEDLPFVPITTSDYGMVLNKKYVYTEPVSSWLIFGDSWAHWIRAAS